MFKWSHSLSLGYVKTWEYEIKQCLKAANMSDINIHNDEINVKGTIRQYRDAIIDIDKKNWLCLVWDDSKNEENGNKLRLYRCFMKDICVEDYVMKNMPFHCRQKLAMLRIGCLPIQVEIGRRQNTPIHERVCRHCNMNCVEDEVHLLLACPLYDDLRSMVTQYIQDSSCSLKDQYCFLLSNPNIQAELGKCVFNIMTRRTLYEV